MKKFVLKLDLADADDKRRALKAVSTLAGVLHDLPMSYLTNLPREDINKLLGRNNCSTCHRFENVIFGITASTRSYILCDPHSKLLEHLGIDEISIDIKGKKLTVIGTVDPVTVVSKLRKKKWPTNIISVGPAKEPEKKPEEPKKEEAKKEETKEEAKKDEPKKEESKDEAKKDEPKKEGEKKAEPEPILGTIMPYRPYYPTMNTYYYMQQHRSIEENPDGCVIL